MPDPKDHLDPKEATEAKLCAYLEGELPPNERAEIEQHLASNPQHRQLLADLAKTREWVRSIPAESSPVDLAEMFQGQAERSLLLDDPADSSRMMFRIPQFLMVAAIVLLTVGVGALVVWVVKGPKSAGNNFALGPASHVTPPATAPTDQSQTIAQDKQDKLATAKDAEVVAPVVAAPVTPAAAAAPGAIAVTGESKDAFARGGFGGGGGGGGRGGGAGFANRELGADATKALAEGARRDRSVQTDLDADAVKSKLVDSGYRMPMGQKTVCFVISADSPPVTDEQVRGFFNRHQLAFDDAITGKHESELVAAANQPAIASGAAQGSLNKATSQSLAFDTAANNAVANNQSTVNSVSNGNLQPTPVVISQSQGDNNSLPNGNFQNFGGQQQGNSQSQFSMKSKLPVLAPTTGPTGEQIYVAYGLTPLQLNLLSASLFTDNLNQSVKQLTLSEGPVVQSPTTAPTGAVTKGQTLTVTVAQLVGPGIEKTNVVKVADDGTIALPMIDPLPAAGTQPAELERKIADKYREANLIPQATVTVAEAETPSTQPTVAATQPATMPSTQTVITDNPANSPAKPANDTVDVVVVIEKSSAVSPPK